MSSNVATISLATNHRPEPNYCLNCIELGQFLELDIPPNEHLLAPWLFARSINMIYAKRGVGKTHVGLGIAYAVGTGTTFLKWKAPKPAKVLYLDGEMSSATLQQRLRGINADQIAQNDFLKNVRIYTPDQQNDRIVDISDPKWHPALQDAIGDAELVIVDNLSCLARSSGNENEAESWLPLQDWGLKQRRLGKAVIFMHHAGKGGQQRGTSRKEDILNVTINLRQPTDYSAESGAFFEVRFEKGRECYGDDTKPFEAQLHQIEGRSTWNLRDVEAAITEKVLELTSFRMKPDEIAQELSISRSSVYRHLKEGKRSGHRRPSNI